MDLWLHTYPICYYSIIDSSSIVAIIIVIRNYIYPFERFFIAQLPLLL